MFREYIIAGRSRWAMNVTAVSISIEFSEINDRRLRGITRIFDLRLVDKRYRRVITISYVFVELFRF